MPEFEGDRQYCDECCSFDCPGHETCEYCNGEICNVCDGCDCLEATCPGYIAHQTGQDL